MNSFAPRLVAHRGASADAPENSQLAIKLAADQNVDGIEFDIRQTSEGQFILCHDANFRRTANVKAKIAKKNLAWITKNVKLADGSPPPSLKQALKLRKKKLALVEVKGPGWANSLNEFVKSNDFSNTALAAFDHDELAKFHALQQNIPCVALTFWRPIHALRIANAYGFWAVSMQWVALNPVVALLARRWEIQLMVYTVNQTWLAKILRTAYPSVGIISNNAKDLI